MNHCNFLKNKFKNIEIIKSDMTHIYKKFTNKIPGKFQNKVSLANTRARLRMTMLYMIAGGSNGIVVGTGNKVEDFGVGFFTKYGDGGVDISPIADLMKSEVYELAHKLKINQEIIDAVPTDGLWDDGRSDEDQLGISYDDLEWAMIYKEGTINKRQSNILKIYNKHRKHNLHKMKEIPVFKK
jgi:NAD+ synthase